MRVFIAGKEKVEARVAENGTLPSYELTRIDTSNMVQAHLDLAKLAEIGQFLLLGDHDAQLAVLREIAKKKAGVVIFDAGLNALPTEQAREGFLTHLVDTIPGERIAIVGVRELSLGELKFCKEHRIRTYSMQSMMMDSLQNVCDSVMECAKSWEVCYAMISLNVLDPAFADVPHPAPGGLSTRELLYFVQRLRKVKSFLAAGVCDGKKAMPVVEKLFAELAVR